MASWLCGCKCRPGCWVWLLAESERAREPASQPEMHLREPQPSHLYAMHRRAVCMHLSRHLHDCCNTLGASCAMQSSDGGCTTLCFAWKSERDLHFDAPRPRITPKCAIYTGECIIFFPLTAHVCKLLCSVQLS